MLSDDDTRQHHTDDVGNAQFTHNNRGKQDDEQYDEEYQGRTRYREVARHVQLSIVAEDLLQSYAIFPMPTNFPSLFLPFTLLLIYFFCTFAQEK